jgi:chromosome segregation ATPase
MNANWLRDAVHERIGDRDILENLRTYRSRYDIAPQSQSVVGGTTLDLVQQAAEAFQEHQARMTESEARTQVIMEETREKLQRALDRLQETEAALRKADRDVDQANVRIREADVAIEQAQERAALAESELCAMEIRLKATEQREHEMREAFDRVERAIRTTLFARGFPTQRGAA